MGMRSPATLSPKEELELLMLEKERRRRENLETGEMQREKIAKNVKEGAVDAGISLLQSTALEYGDEGIGAIVATYKKASGDKRPFEELYEEAKKDALGKVEAARERSPIATFVADVLAPNPLKLSKILSKATGPVTTAALTGYGYAEGTPEEQATTTAISAGAGTAGKIIGKAGKAIFGEPAAIESRYLGLDKDKSQLVERTGFEQIEEVNQSLKRLREKGLFSKAKNSFSTKTGTWRGAKFDIEKPRAANLKDIEKKLADAENKASKEIEKILEKESADFKKLALGEEAQGRLFDPDHLELFGKNTEGMARLDQIKSRMASIDVDKLPEVEETIQNSFRNLTRGTNSFTLTDLHREKQRLYKFLHGKFGEESTGIAVETKKQLARMYKDMIDSYTKDPMVKELNDTMHDIFKFKGAVKGKVESEFFASPIKDTRGPFIGNMAYRAERMAESIADPTRPYRSKVGRMIEDIPTPIRSYMEGTAEAVPGRLARPFIGREPQSIPEELVSTRFPRSSEELIKNKDFVLAKVAQEAPQIFDMIRDVLEREPETVSMAMPALTQMAPQLFDFDKYNRFDGKILDPESKAIARKDIMSNDNLSNTEKIAKIQLLNKTGEYND